MKKIMRKIGFFTSSPEAFKVMFPTSAEPTLIPIEPSITPDDQLVVNELRHQGYVVEPIIWGGGLETCEDYQLIVMRSTWDYMDNAQTQQQFMQWLKQLEKSPIPIINPVKLMQWLLDKHYLQAFNKAGVAIIPTTYLAQTTQFNLLNYFEEKGPFIVKPCVGAAGIGLYYIHTATEAKKWQTEFNAQINQESYMVQDFVPEITTHGEWSLIFLGGEYSHAVHKKPAAGSIFVHAERGGTLAFSEPPKHLIQFAKHVFKKILPTFNQSTGSEIDPTALLYCRLDIIDTTTGPVLIECEGVEPELFFRAKPKSEVLFVKAIEGFLQNVTQ